MKKMLGYVTFEDSDVKVGDIIKNDLIVYSTIPDSLKQCRIDSEKTVAMVSYSNYELLEDSEYYGYYNMKLSHECRIEKVYSYEEVINYMINDMPNELEIVKFLKTFSLSEEDKKKFSNISNIISRYIELYQPKESPKQKVKKNGKHSN